MALSSLAVAVKYGLEKNKMWFREAPESPTFTLIGEHGQISKIIIDYEYRSYSPLSHGEWTYGRERHHKINKIDNEFETQDGKIIDQGKIYALENSFINLHISGGLKTIPAFLSRFYQNFRVEIIYENDNRVILYSDSGFYGSVPWNVVAQGKLFVQYTAEISSALFDLLSDIDPENWEPFEWKSFEEHLHPYSPRVDLISDRLPPEVSKVDFSEKELYLGIIRQSDIFRPLLDYFDLIDLDQLFFSLNENNLDASVVKGVVEIRWQGGEVIPFLPLEFENQELLKLGLPVDEVGNIVTKIDGHGLTKRVRSHLPNVSVVVYLEGAYPGVLRAGEGHYFKFEGWEVSNGFIYLPEFDTIHVGYLSYLGKPDNVVDTADFLSSFEISGYEGFIRKNLIRLSITKSGVRVNLKENALIQNLEYVQKLEEKYASQIRIHPYLQYPPGEGLIVLDNVTVSVDKAGTLRLGEVHKEPNHSALLAALIVGTIAIIGVSTVFYTRKMRLKRPKKRMRSKKLRLFHGSIFPNDKFGIFNIQLDLNTNLPVKSSLKNAPAIFNLWCGGVGFKLPFKSTEMKFSCLKSAQILLHWLLESGAGE